MTNFLDVRALSGGGGVSNQVQIGSGTSGNDYSLGVSLSDLQSFIHGQHVLIGTHGFNVNRANGVYCLSYWASLMRLPDSSVFVGLLWPGDSESFYALSYPVEPKNATAAGNMIGPFLDANFGNAASISLVSHSLGARVLLQTISQMKRPVRRAILMAGAIGDDCLTAEFSGVPQNVAAISVLASKEDDVLRWAFPVGDLGAEIVDRDHPWWESALGRFGPSQTPAHFQPPDQIPDAWNYGHLNYLQVNPPAPQAIPPPTDVPADGVQFPLNGVAGWQEAWSASFVSTRFG